MLTLLATDKEFHTLFKHNPAHALLQAADIDPRVVKSLMFINLADRKTIASAKDELLEFLTTSLNHSVQKLEI